MPIRAIKRLPAFLALMAACLSLSVSSATGTRVTEARGQSSMGTAFRDAAREFHVPEAVLLAVSYHLSLWEDHAGHPSTSGGYGPMHLTQVDAARGEAAAHTLQLASRITGVPPTSLQRDPTQNIRGGAALLARYAVKTTGTRPPNLAAWYGAVALYSGSTDGATALGFARRVYRTINSGASRTIASGERVRIMPHRVEPLARTVLPLHLRHLWSTSADCPPELSCRFVPAAYQINNPANPEDYGNYDVAHRVKDHIAIRYIVIHDTEGSYTSAINAFRNPLRYASANYVVRASDGLITQMVRNANIAWHAGNYYVNMHAIGIEHEGVAVQGATWYSGEMYDASASLVAYLAQRYHVPLDRAHILGHDEVPGPTPRDQSSQHWDPGPFWDWQHYMELLQAALSATEATDSTVLTINPSFADNQPPVTDCSGPVGCAAVTAQPANFVYLRRAADPASPLVSDAALHGGATPGTTRADDWGDKAVTGQQFVAVDRHGDWTAIDYAGQKAWIYNPAAAPVAFSSLGQIVTPRRGLTSIAVYGRAYPEIAAYPRYIHKVEPIVPLQYTIPAGQKYVAVDRVGSDFYWSPTQKKHAVVRGKTAYYQIFFNHRFAFVKASDVTAQAKR